MTARALETGRAYAAGMIGLFALQAAAANLFGWWLDVEGRWFYEVLVPVRAVWMLWLDGDHRLYHGAMLLVAAGTLGLGLQLTRRRLAGLNLALWPAGFLLIPLVNVFVISILAVLEREHVPGAAPIEGPRAERPDPAVLQPAPSPSPGILFYADGLRGRHTPPETRPGKSRPLWCFAAVTIPAVAGLAFALLGTNAFSWYGWGLFVGVPFAIPFSAVSLYRLYCPGGAGASLGVGFLSLLTWGGLLLVTGFEGLGCLVMAVPLILPAGAAGAIVGHAFCRSVSQATNLLRVMPLMLLLVPGIMGAERLSGAPAPLIAVSTALEIDAAPAVVWRNVLDFPPLAEPGEWYFRAGIAYPTRACINGQGVGAVRECIFTTGTFVEPIEVWDEPCLLRFSVTAQPPPMREWTFYREIHPPHLDGFLVSQRGQFRLEALPGGRTRLEGTTWYRHHMWPVAYWQCWSDFLIHRIHLRVLKHVKVLAEAEAAS